MNISKMISVLGLVLVLLLSPTASIALEREPVPASSAPSQGIVPAPSAPGQGITLETVPGSVVHDVPQPALKSDRSDAKKMKVKRSLLKAREKVLESREATESAIGASAKTMLLVTNKGTDYFEMVVGPKGHFIGHHYKRDANGILQFTGNYAWGFWDSENGVWSGVYEDTTKQHATPESEFFGIHKDGKWVAIGLVNNQVVVGNYYHLM